MPTVTNLWPDKHGKPHYPVSIMDNVHIRNSFKLCWYRIYLAEDKVRKEEYAQSYGIFITKKQADKWIPIFKEEARKRKIILQKPNQLSYKQFLETRQTKKMLSEENFQKTINYDQRTNDFGKSYRYYPK